MRLPTPDSGEPKKAMDTPMVVSAIADIIMMTEVANAIIMRFISLSPYVCARTGPSYYCLFALNALPRPLLLSAWQCVITWFVDQLPMQISSATSPSSADTLAASSNERCAKLSETAHSFMELHAPCGDPGARSRRPIHSFKNLLI